MTSLSESIALISFSISVFLSLALFHRREQKQPSKILGTILTGYSVAFLCRYLVLTESALCPYLPLLFLPVIFMFGPAVYFYFRACLFGKSVQYSEVRGLLIFPIAAEFIFTLLLLFFPEFRDIKNILHQKGAVEVFSVSYICIGILHCSYFLWKSHKETENYRSEFEENYSSDALSSLLWLRIFMIFNIGMIILYLIIAALLHMGVSRTPVSPTEGILNMLLIYLILYYMVFDPTVFAIQEKEEEPETAPLKKEKYSKQAVSEEDRKKYIRMIRSFMEKEKPYLNDEISLTDLSSSLGIPKHHFSITVNSELNMNFFQFISFYRVKEAERLLSLPEYSEHTILRIALDSGFQSKSAFNKAFKQFTGFTPAEYRLQKRI